MPLVLTRSINESVIITTEDGEEIVVTVTKIEGKQVKLGFDAHESIEIMREELLVIKD